MVMPPANAQAMITPYEDDPDTSIDEPMSRHTLIGLPAPTRLPAEAPGTRYRRLYPVQLDQPLEVTIHWGQRHEDP